MKRVIEFLITNPQYMASLDLLQKKRNGVPIHLEQCIYKLLADWIEFEEHANNYEDIKAFEDGLERLDYNTDTILYRYSLPLKERYKRWGPSYEW